MLDENIPVVEETTENTVEQPAEQIVEEEKAPEKVYTEEEFNTRLDELLSKKIARKESKIRREYEEKFSKYREAESVLNAGMGTKSIDEAVNSLKDFYSKKGIQMPTQTRGYSEQEESILANAYANEIINSGYDELVEEVDRLADKGVNNMTPREKAIFTKLAEARQNEEGRRELAKIGVKEEVFNGSKFKEFRGMFDKKTPVQKVYELYQKMNPPKEVEPIGSMKGKPETVHKDYYTPEEARMLTSKDLDDPQVMAAVEKSMALWETQK